MLKIIISFLYRKTKSTVANEILDSMLFATAASQKRYSSGNFQTNGLIFLRAIFERFGCAETAGFSTAGVEAAINRPAAPVNVLGFHIYIPAEG